MEEADNSRVDFRVVEDDECDGSQMEGKQNREINIPSILIPFLSDIKNTLLYPYS